MFTNQMKSCVEALTGQKEMFNHKFHVYIQSEHSKCFMKLESEHGQSRSAHIPGKIVVTEKVSFMKTLELMFRLNLSRSDLNIAGEIIPSLPSLKSYTLLKFL